MSGSELPSREELLAVIEAQARTIEMLTARVEELERQLGRTPGTSSQPPSADGPAVWPSRAERRRSARKPGKQPGAGGSALLQTSTPDEIIDHVPDACGGCGTDLSGAIAAAMVCRQVHDIPTITPIVTEHRLHRRLRWWLHVASTTTLTAYHLHPSRGRAALTEFDVLPDYCGTVVHDALSVYDAYSDARHALCCAHLARELVAAAEAHPAHA